MFDVSINISNTSIADFEQDIFTGLCPSYKLLNKVNVGNTRATPIEVALCF